MLRTLHSLKSKKTYAAFEGQTRTLHNMKEFVISEAKTETAVLVGLITPNQNEAKTTEYLDELEFLADTAGAKVLKRFTQRVNGPSSVT